jgi:hypothetical protein
LKSKSEMKIVSEASGVSALSIHKLVGKIWILFKKDMNKFKKDMSLKIEQT